MHNKQKLVLDFDGTIIRLFENYDLKNLKLKAKEILQNYGINYLLTNDIFEVFKLVYNSILEPIIKKELLITLDDIIVEGEIEALNTGIVVDGFNDFVNFMKNNQLPFSIVSNNSKRCIDKFLEKYNVSIPVIGRNALRPDLMKPNNHMLKQMEQLLNCNCLDIIYVGDNIRDYQCAVNNNSNFIALCPTEKKELKIKLFGVSLCIVHNFYELLDILKNNFNF